MNIQEQIRDYIVDNFLFGDGKHLEPDTSFREKSVIDSMGILDLIGFLENTYEISIEDEDLIPENFDSLRVMSQFVDRKLGECSAV